MKKGFIKYSIIWLFALGVFNAVAFLLPNELNTSFWIGYGAISAAFVLQLISTAVFFNKDLLQKRLGNIPVPVFCMIGLVCLLAASVVYAVIGATVAIVVCYVVVGVQYIANIVGQTMVAHSESTAVHSATRDQCSIRTTAHGAELQSSRIQQQ